MYLPKASSVIVFLKVVFELLTLGIFAGNSKVLPDFFAINFINEKVSMIVYYVLTSKWLKGLMELGTGVD